MRNEDADRTTETPGSYRRTTVSICEQCLKDCPAEVGLASNGHAVLRKHCPEHGDHEVLLSRHGMEYLNLDHGYHRLFPLEEESAPREDTYFLVTNACNQNCPYCLTEANRYPYFDEFGRAQFEAFLAKHRGSKVSLIGGEPLMHPDFLQFADRVGQAGKILVVYTNGLGFADETLLSALIRAAPRLEVRMTFEGFDEDDYRHLPGGKAIRERKLKALGHLERHRVPTTLGRTIPREEDPTRLRESLAALIDFASRKDFVRGLTFQGTMALGAERHKGAANALSVDQVMDLVVEALPIRYPREQAYLIQRMVHILARAFNLPICLYVQTAVLFRERSGWVDLGYYLDERRLKPRLDRRISRWPCSRWRLLLGLGLDVLSSTRPMRVWALMRQALRILPIFARRYEFSRIPKTVLPLLSITVCDPVFMDAAIARRCEKGVHTNVRGEVITELCSEMAIRHVRERAANPVGTVGASA